MPTENPKISAYVLQVVYDRFKEYQEERELSMSQAVMEILAHYFGINLEEPTKEFTNGLPNRLLQVEESLEELKRLYTQLVSKVNQAKTTGESLTGENLNISDFQILVESEPQSGIPEDLVSELQSELEISLPINNNESELLVELKSEPLNEEYLEVPVQLNLVDSQSDLLSSLLKELSLPATKLGKRLSIDRTTLSSRNKKASAEEFANMTFQKDPDGIGWVYSDQLKSYVPYGELSPEQIESLKGWKKEQSTK